MVERDNRDKDAVSLLFSLRGDGEHSSNASAAESPLPLSDEDDRIVDAIVKSAAAVSGTMTDNITASSSTSTNNMQISDTMPPLEPLPPLPTATSVTMDKNDKKTVPPKKKVKTVGSMKYNVKPKDPKRDTSVPFDEMKRLMRVYGPVKCLRNRTPKDSQSAKVESVKRKFYRWFPDLDERFIRTSEGWYTPKAGHEAEMAYREMMRKTDQESLVKKRNSKRSITKNGAFPPLV